MQAPLPIQFLVGITRVMAVFFGIQTAAVMSEAFVVFALQRAALPDPSRFPNIWALFVPIFIVYLAMVLAVWFAAPFICKVAVRADANEVPSVEPSTSNVCWNEAMIFLTGTGFVAWGITRIAHAVQPLLAAYVQHRPTELSIVDSIGVYTTVGLIGFGAILMGRFAHIHRWMQRRKSGLESMVG